jgi:hypothetical protein
MNGIPLMLGPLEAKGLQLYRSGIRWLCDDGHVCRPNEVVGYCNVVLDRQGNFRRPQPFADERELQIAFAPRIGGRLRIAAGSSLGGYLDIVGARPWAAETIVGHLEPNSDDASPTDIDPTMLRLLMLAGRRVSDLADVHTGLLPGWHSRARAWWQEGQEAMSTLLSLGICDAAGIVRGDRYAFTEMFEAAAAPTQLVSIPDHPIVPCATILLEQLSRTDETYQVIAEDLMRGLTDRGAASAPDDLMFAGTLLTALRQSPIQESYDVLTPQGLRRQGPADALLLSVTAESPSMLRHKKLGYHLHMLHHHRSAVGPAARAWLRSAFEPATRTVDDIRRDYRSLIDAVGAATGARILVLNRMSTSGFEDISNYAPFDHPLGSTLANVAAKEMNLMLHDLAEERDLSIVDVDAIATALGGAENIPDGIHLSGALLSIVRDEILGILATPPAGAAPAMQPTPSLAPLTRH